MKKPPAAPAWIVCFLRLTVFCLVLLTLFSHPALPLRALEGGTEDAPETEEPTDTLPIPEEFDSLFPDGPTKETVERFDLAYFFRFLRESLSALLLPTLRELALLCALLLLFSLLQKAGDCGLFKAGTGSMLRLFSTAVLVLHLFPLLEKEFTALQDYFTKLSGFLSGFLPTMEILSIAGGNLQTAAVGSVGLSMTCAALDLVGQAWLLPLMRICLALYVISSLLPEGELAPAADLAGRFFLFLCALFMAVLLAVFSFQTFLSSSADGAGARALRFTAGRFLPVVGSAVSEATKTMLSSLKLMKSVTGGAGIVVVLLFSLPLLLRQLMLKAAFQAASVLAKMTGGKDGAACLLGASRLLDYLAALTAMFSVSAIFQMAVFMATLPAVQG